MVQEYEVNQLGTREDNELFSYFILNNKVYKRVSNGSDVISTNKYNGSVVISPGHVSTDNSTSSILAGDAVYTGTWEDITNFGIIVITLKASHESATDGLMVEFSSDGTNVDSDDTFTIPAATGKTFSFQAATKYFRVKYTNGSTTQTYFRLQTILKPYYVKPSSHRINDAIIGEDDAELVKSVLTALNDDGTFSNISATKSNNLKVANVENGLSIAKGDVTETTFIHKFGAAPDFDTADGFVTIWDGSDDANIDQMSYQYSTSAIIDSLSSSSALDTFDIEIQGLDSNYDLVTQTITLTGQTRKALDTNLIRIFRMKNVSSSDNIGHIYCYENVGLSGGVPTDSSKVRAVIQPGNNQTLMAIYTIPNGKTGYMRDWYASTAGANKSSSFLIELRARPESQVFQLKHLSAIDDSGPSYIQHKYEEPEKFTEKTDIELRCKITASTTEAAVSGGFDIVLVDN